MAAPVIDFWFSIGSTYSYLSVMRLGGLESREDVRFNWRPFNVRQIMIEQNNRPFVGKPVRLAYMWRDVERRAGKYGIPIRVPAPYPLKEMALANQIALLGAEEGWCSQYAISTYGLWFQNGLEPGIEPNLSDSLREIGQDLVRVLAEAQSGRIISGLLAETERATSLGIFGSPSFVVGDEVFWGDDRLEDALSWARWGTLAQVVAP